MGRKKCMTCKEWITDDVVEDIIGGKEMHFCSESCRDKAIKRQKQKEKEKAERTAVYDIICDIFGYKIKNTQLFNEWKHWNDIASNEKIKYYLMDNKQYIINVLRRIDDKESRRVMYFSAILKNSLHDYNFKIAEPIKTVINTDDNFIPYKNNKVVTRRKGFAEDDD